MAARMRSARFVTGQDSFTFPAKMDAVKRLPILPNYPERSLGHMALPHGKRAPPTNSPVEDDGTMWMGKESKSTIAVGIVYSRYNNQEI
jgi:hypothetical protein